MQRRRGGEKVEGESGRREMVRIRIYSRFLVSVQGCWLGVFALASNKMDTTKRHGHAGQRRNEPHEMSHTSRRKGTSPTPLHLG